MAWIKVKSSLSGQVDLVTEDAYETYFKASNVYTIIEEPVKEEIKAKEPIQKPKTKQKTK